MSCIINLGSWEAFWFPEAFWILLQYPVVRDLGSRKIYQPEQIFVPICYVDIGEVDPKKKNVDESKCWDVSIASAGFDETCEAIDKGKDEPR